MAKYKLLLPKMGESVAEATIIKWNKNIGDSVEIYDAVIEIATDKVDSEVPSPVKGKLILKLCNENDVVQVGSLIAIIETDEPDETTPTIFTSPNKQVDKVEEAPAEIIPADQQIPGIEQLNYSPATTAEPKPAPVMRFYSPLVKNIAIQEGIGSQELDTIPGTGAEGRLTKDDLLAYIQKRHSGQVPTPGYFSPAAQPESKTEVTESTLSNQPVYDALPDQPLPQGVNLGKAEFIQTVDNQINNLSEPISAHHHTPTVETTNITEHKNVQAAPISQPKHTNDASGDEIIEMDRMRKLIADHMLSSVQTSPHVCSFVEADVTNLFLWREKVKKEFEKREESKLTYTPMFIEAVTHAIKDFPMINIQVKGNQIIKKHDINIGMAAALPNGNLIVPVIHKADELNIIGLSKVVNDLATRARANKLLPDEVQGGTFTITNIGTFGNIMGTPIINQPQVAILALGAIKKRPAVIETPSGDMIAIRHMMYLSMSYDHRVVDGFLGGSFLKRVADYLEAWDINREY